MNKTWIRFAAGGAVVVVLVIAAVWQRSWFIRQALAPTPDVQTSVEPLPSADGKQVNEVVGERKPKEDFEVIASDLNIPWEIAFLPNGELLVTERPGQLIKIGKDKTSIPISGVRHVGEGGLLGLALHPNFSRNNLIYLYMTSSGGSGVINRVERYKLTDATLSERQVILDNIPGSQFHDGGRIAFSPNGLLYITTGDAGNESNAQDLNSLAGKILRLKDDGAVPTDNPFNSPVYSYGHRNPQGLAWDSQGRLWATEHGRSGIRTGLDEVNLIEKGGNYGWPEIQGDEEQVGMRKPAANSGPNTTWAPSGAVFYKDNLLFAGLRGEALYKAEISETAITGVRALFSGQFGRLRTVAEGPDGFLYILTNNRDGRGTPQPNDDKIIRINPDLLE